MNSLDPTRISFSTNQTWYQTSRLCHRSMSALGKQMDPYSPLQVAAFGQRASSQATESTRSYMVLRNLSRRSRCLATPVSIRQSQILFKARRTCHFQRQSAGAYPAYHAWTSSCPSAVGVQISRSISCFAWVDILLCMIFLLNFFFSFPSALGDIVFAAEELRYAAQAIGRVTGDIGVEDILDSLFKDFCIGK